MIFNENEDDFGEGGTGWRLYSGLNGIIKSKKGLT
jgi:hypothetical protein